MKGERVKIIEYIMRKAGLERVETREHMEKFVETAHRTGSNVLWEFTNTAKTRGRALSEIRSSLDYPTELEFIATVLLLHKGKVQQEEARRIGEQLGVRVTKSPKLLPNLVSIGVLEKENPKTYVLRHRKPLEYLLERWRERGHKMFDRMDRILREIRKMEENH